MAPTPPLSRQLLDPPRLLHFISVISLSLLLVLWTEYSKQQIEVLHFSESAVENYHCLRVYLQSLAKLLFTDWSR